MRVHFSEMPLHLEYIEFARAEAARIRDELFAGCPFWRVTMPVLDHLGFDTRNYRARAERLMKAGYDWQTARDVATYEALLSLGVLE